MVIKRDGTRVPFDPEKVLRGLQAACGKEVGVRVASQLRTIDPIVYIRYASEYFNFQDLEDISREVSDLQEAPPVFPTQSDLFTKK